MASATEAVRATEVKSVMSAPTNVTVPVLPATEKTASVLSTFSQADPVEITQSPIFQLVIPSSEVDPATETT